MKLVILTDIHFANQSTIPERQSSIADILLLRAVHRINRYIKPDIVAILGDIIDNPQSPSAIEQYNIIKKILDILTVPYIIIPGNHDIQETDFYKIFDKPDDINDIANIRLLTFIDSEQPGYNAIREKNNLERMKTARNNFDGLIITLQHVPIFPPGTTDCPYNYINADEIIAIMKQYKIDLAISGHFHKGFELMKTQSENFIAVPALCEQPFQFVELDINNTDNINVIYHQLAMPKNLNLIDNHIHTHFAYCNENMDIQKAKLLAQALGLAEIRFSEHSSHLYWNHIDYSKGIFYREGMKAANPQHFRIDDYFNALKDANCPQKCVGLEVDCDWKGNPIIQPTDEQKTGFLIGAIHSLPITKMPEMKNVFISIHEKFLQHNIKILAHPFRIFRRTNNPTPQELFKPTVKLLKKHNIAAEINFHTNEPPAEFIKLCIDAGVKLSLGSDAHNLYEVGEFYPHLELLKNCGICHSDLKHIIINQLNNPTNSSSSP